MNQKRILNQKRERRAKRNRANIFGTAEKPRLSVFKSNTSIYVQVINDEIGKTLASASSVELKPDQKKNKKADQAAEVGKVLGEKAASLGIKSLVLDRGRYHYHGRVASLVEAVRKTGIKI